MGLPLPWITLNLLHLFWTDQAALNSKTPEGIYKKSTVICGDDLAGHWRPAMVSAYHHIVKESNGLLSEGKHFESRRGIVYTEICAKPCGFKKIASRPPKGSMWEKAKKKGLKGMCRNNRDSITRHVRALEIYNYLPIKGLLHDSALDEGNETTPWFERIGPALTSSGIAKTLKNRLLLLPLYKGAYDYFNNANIPAHIPREFDGPGLPPL